MSATDAAGNQSPNYQRIRIDLPAPSAAIARPPAEFATICVIDMMRLKSASRRALTRKQPPSPQEAETFQRLIAILDAIAATPRIPLPEVSVVAWPETGGIRLDLALFDATLLISARLSESWIEGRLSRQAVHVIANGLTQYRDLAATTYRPTGRSR